MRLINQSGRVDIPYEHCSIMYNKDSKTIVAYDYSTHDSVVMGCYSSNQRCEKALEKMRATYAGRVNNCEKAKIEFQKFDIPGYFKFPQDGDVFDENDILS